MGFNIVSKKPSIVWAKGDTIDVDRLDSKFYDVKFIDSHNVLLNSKSSKSKLSEIINTMNAPIGWQGIPSNAYRDKGSGIPLIRVQNIQDNKINWETVIDVDPSIYNSQPAIQAEEGNIIITRVGHTIGKLCKVPQGIPKVAMGQNLTRISFDESKVDVDYIYAFLNTSYCRKQMDRFSYGGAQPSLTNKNIRDLLIVIPSFKTQTYIGDKVRKAEQMREEALQLRKEAEQIIKTILNLEELTLKINQLEKRSFWINSEDLFLNRLDSQYYGVIFQLIENHMKKISSEYISIGKLINYTFTGNRLNESEIGKKIYFIQSGNISENFLELNGEQIKTVIETPLNKVDFSDILFAKDGETIGKLAPCYTKEDIYINEHTICVKLKEAYKHYSSFIYYFLISEVGKVLIKREATGTAQKGISKNFLDNIKIPLVKESIVKELYEITVDLTEKLYTSNRLILEATSDVESLIEGSFEESKIIEAE
ncbi:restriction endonuclease subunit S [Fictibacillus barbaricus]|uniref:Type I restriction enzyme S subunit n=1 Tax=Fictibacillus barbaricus TaxID=182136 RepID=A0ABU1U411_9BACL|nr:restriction endonuclease subunit S [Fictibacillus barbaricus]MDR7074158.1 type I restriction enzyme S subunit [Fictibacillus barbaricus]